MTRIIPQRPLIVGLPCDVKTFGDLPFHAVGEKYIDAVRAVTGALPLLIPVTRDPIDIEQILSVVDGIFLPGSRSNVAPDIYGGTPPRPENVSDSQRDAVTLPLIRAAVANATPLLAVCRGMQEMNVAFGGTLHQFVHELPGRHDHRANREAPAEQQYEPAHPVDVLPGGVLGTLLGNKRLQVNSWHSQGVDRLAPNLRPEAVALDGTIEAVSVIDAPGFALGIQWHPEWRVRDNPAYLAIFQAFGNALREGATQQRGNDNENRH